MNNEILFKPNSLIMAKSDCDNIKNNEYKVYDTVLQRCQFYQGYGYRKAELTRAEIKSIVKTNDYTTIKEINNTFDKFMNITLKFKIGSKNVTSSAISEYIYDESNDTYSIVISENVFAILMEYSKYGYSPIDLKIIRKAKSYYTQKIYAMLRSWSKLNQKVYHTYTLEEIKTVCDVFDGSSYNEYKVFKRDVLKKAIKEINTNFNMEVEIVKENRVNRKVNSIEFLIIDYEPRKYDFNKEEDSQSKIIKVEEEVNDGIDSIDYVNMIDMDIKESLHEKFLQDFPDYKKYMNLVKKASTRTIDSTGGKAINRNNYNYFKVSLKNLISEDIV